MPLVPSDLASTTELASELHCTRRNVNVAVLRFGIQRFAGGHVSRSQFLEAKQRLGSSIQAQNSRKAKGKVKEPDIKADSEESRAQQGGKSSGHVGANGYAAGNGHASGHEDGQRPVEKSLAEAQRGLAWLRFAIEKQEYDLRCGKLLRAEEVRAAFQAIGRIVAAGREIRPHQLAPLLVDKKDISEIEETIRREGCAEDTRIANEIAQKFGLFTDDEAKTETK